MIRHTKSVVTGVENIDWSRLAEPQEDQYDTNTALAIAMSDGSLTTNSTGHSRLKVVPDTICNGAVAVRHTCSRPPGYPTNINGPLNHPNILIAEKYLNGWPTVAQQFRRLIHSFHPMVMPAIPVEEWTEGIGSSSHSDDNNLGIIYATIFDPMGLAQAFVHELAHNKLRALGVEIEFARRLFLNSANKRYPSPVVTETRRPMTAVFHAVYSFTYIVALDVEMLKTETNSGRQHLWRKLLDRNLKKLEVGIPIINNYAELDDEGRAFMDGYFAWFEATLQKIDQL